MSQFRRSLVYSFSERYAMIIINLAMTAVVARLLTPTEIGIFAVGMSVVLLIETIREFGVGIYLIQARELTREDVRTAFTVSLALSTLLGGTVWALAGPVADFYSEPGVKVVLRLATVGFVLVPFSGPILALLRRDLNFGPIAVINIAGSLANAVTVVTLATLDFGYVSLAWGSIA